MILRHVTLADADFLYRLLQHRPKEANISHVKMPTWERHIDFIKSDPYRAWYVIHDLGDDRGSVYLTGKDEVGIFLWPGNEGKGYGKAALERLMALHPRRTYYANIAPSNDRSLAFFAKMGFRGLQYTFRLDTCITPV